MLFCIPSITNASAIQTAHAEALPNRVKHHYFGVSLDKIPSRPRRHRVNRSSMEGDVTTSDVTDMARQHRPLFDATRALRLGVAAAPGFFRAPYQLRHRCRRAL